MPEGVILDHGETRIGGGRGDCGHGRLSYPADRFHRRRVSLSRRMRAIPGDQTASPSPDSSEDPRKIICPMIAGAFPEERGASHVTIRQKGGVTGSLGR